MEQVFRNKYRRKSDSPKTHFGTSRGYFRKASPQGLDQCGRSGSDQRDSAMTLSTKVEIFGTLQRLGSGSVTKV